MTSMHALSKFKILGEIWNVDRVTGNLSEINETDSVKVNMKLNKNLFTLNTVSK